VRTKKPPGKTGRFFSSIRLNQGVCSPSKFHNDADFQGNTGAFPEPLIGIQMRLSILLSAALLIGAVLLVFRDELQARNPHHLNRLAEPVTQCGFWGDMSAGMSCR
jgi:hypothetical protein